MNWETRSGAAPKAKRTGAISKMCTLGVTASTDSPDCGAAQAASRHGRSDALVTDTAPADRRTSLTQQRHWLWHPLLGTQHVRLRWGGQRMATLAPLLLSTPVKRTLDRAFISEPWSSRVFSWFGLPLYAARCVAVYRSWVGEAGRGQGTAVVPRGTPSADEPHPPSGPPLLIQAPCARHSCNHRPLRCAPLRSC